MSAIDVFLCHNSRDKPFVRQIAEGLEVEFGLPHFLDAHAIPVGEKFLPWIDKALAESRGCAIFLGANGWGETHFWEAQRALDRSREDPTFRLIPVALPGIRDEDMRRLGAGTLFSQVNWADFRSGAADTEAVSKLRSTLQGKSPEPGIGLPQLTPYLVRRDAARWQDKRGKDKSILYRGRQLAAAEALRVSQPDLMGGAAITDFLIASSVATTRRALTFAVASCAAAVAVAGFAYRANVSGKLALSRFLASEARQAPAADTGLLIAVQATRVSDAPEAFGALLEQLSAHPHMRNMIRLGGASALSVHVGNDEAVYAGLADGTVKRFDLKSHTLTTIAQNAGAAITAIASIPQTGELWLGTQDGRIIRLALPRAGNPIDIRRDGADVDNHTFTAGLPIVSMAVSPLLSQIAVGTHNHKFAIIDRAQRKITRQMDIKAQRATSLSFTPDGQALAVGSSQGLITTYSALTGEELRKFTTARTGDPMALAFSRLGHLRAVDSGGTLSIFNPTENSETPRSLDSDPPSAAAVGPRREFAPTSRRDIVVLGFGGGDVGMVLANDADLLRVKAHSQTVYAVALSEDGRIAASTSADGSAAIWDLRATSPLLTWYPPPGGEVISLAYTEGGDLLAAVAGDDTAKVFQMSSDRWEEKADLADSLKPSAGAARLNAAAKQASDGFEPIQGRSIESLVFDGSRKHLAWITRSGDLYWSNWPPGESTRVLEGSGKAAVDVVLAESGRAGYLAEEGGWISRFDLATFPATVVRRHLAGEIRKLAVAPDNQSVFVSLEDKTLRKLTFDTADVQETSRVPLPGAVGQLGTSFRSRIVVTVGAGSTAGTNVGAVSNEKYRQLHSRHVGRTGSAVAISDKAGVIAMVDLDGQLHLWDLASSVPMASAKLSTRPLTALTISTDGGRLAFANIDGDIYELSLKRTDWVTRACDIVRRNLTDSEWKPLAPDRAPDRVCEDAAGE